MGCAPILAIVVIIIALLTFGANEGAGFYFENCMMEEEDMMDCLIEAFEDEEEEPKEGSVVATGEYSYKDYSITVVANIPLKGGNVTGTVSGSCSGQVKGTYDGQNSGVISGKLMGSCDPFFIKIPASAEYNGTVNKTARTVPIGFTGKGAGITHQGSMTLTWPEKTESSDQ